MTPVPVHLRLPALAGFFVAVAWVLGGCATPQTTQLMEPWPPQLPPTVQLVHTPFIPQEEHECGPAALAMVLQAAGIAASADELSAEVYLPGRKGSLQVELLAASRRHGVPAYVLPPRLDQVLQEVAAGHPVLVFQNLSLPIYPVWHYAVIIGYDRANETVTLHSGTTRSLQMSFTTFERTWARGAFWAMVALPPAQLPATAEPARMAQSIAALERIHPEAAFVAYNSARTRWPTQRGLLLGAGNSAYALQRWTEAEQAYRHALAVDSEFADAWNNLAELLWQQQRPQEATAAIARAVALGGPRLAQYQALQKRIEDGTAVPQK